MGLIDFSMSAVRVENHVRGFSPWPGAYAHMPEGTLKIHRARAVPFSGGARPGEIVEASAKKGLLLACGEGAIEVIEMQAPNAKTMTAKAYLAGKSLPVGGVLNEVQP